MAKRVTLTNQGLSLLASSSEATGQYYWLGYYALAYVPNLWKNDTVSLPEDDCGNVNSDSVGSVEITETDTDNITATMTRLTKFGDMIYNVWQGDLNGTGYMGCASDGSAGGDLFALTLYNTNVKKHYRYVLDENGNNTLVGWIEDPSYSDGSMLGKHVYKGTDGYVSSTLPIPAPLYYLGDVTGKTSVDSFFDELPTFEDTSGYNGNGADLYPFITITLKSAGNPTLDVPRVSADYRGYTDSQGNPGTFNYGGTPPFDTPITAPGIYFDSTEIPYPLDPINLQFDETSWFAADQTFNINGSTATDTFFGEEFWKLHTISNYNIYHAPVNSIGHVRNSDLSNRNMAKVTKFFPISNYKVINSESGFTSNSELVEVATAIKLSIDVDITPPTLNQGFDEECQLNEKSNIEFFDQYGKSIHPTDAVDEYGNNIYESTHTSFKFNRIGIYAVPLRKAPYVQDQGFGTTSNGEKVELQFQINPDDEPVLFAVLDWDNTIAMSDTGDGITQFSAEIDVNLESPIGVDDTALLRNTTIFYNMYEDDALHWYQNQLITTASTSNAITEIGLEVAHIKNAAGESKCCPAPDLSGKYAPLNHSHDFLRNLMDGNNALENGLKGIITAQEGTIIDFDTYKLGNASMVLGDNTAVSSDRSIIGNGIDSYINKESYESGILSGKSNIITDASIRSAIIAGISNIIDFTSVNSFIGTGSSNVLTYATSSGIVSGYSNTMVGATGSNLITESFIGAGNNNDIIATSSNTYTSAIVAGIYNTIDDSISSIISAGSTNTITGSVNSFIGAGADNEITSASNWSIIGSGSTNTIVNAVNAVIAGGFTNNTEGDFSFIGAGSTNIIGDDATYSSIVSGETNYIGVEASHSFVGSGSQNTIFRIDFDNDNVPLPIVESAIIAGRFNNISESYSIIGAGQTNNIDVTFASIGAGQFNYIGIIGSYSAIGAGQYNYILSGFGGILSGQYNYIGSDSTFGIIGGGRYNYIGYNPVDEAWNFNADFASILGGQNNIIDEGGDFAAITGGRDALVNKRGEIAHSNGAFYNDITPTQVDAYNKHSVIMLRGVTTPVDPNIYLSLENSGVSDFIIERGEGFSGTLNIMGYMQNAFTPDACTLNDFRTLDIVYNELHSISGVYTKDDIVDVIKTTAVSGLSYNEYDRYTEKAVTGNGYDTNIIAINSMSTTDAINIDPVTVDIVTSSPHGLNTGDLINVSNSLPISYNIIETIITVTGASSFTYTTLGPVETQNPTDIATTGLPTVTHVIYGPREIDHAPSIVDTVLDYRYTTNPGSRTTFGTAIGEWVQSEYPKIQMSVNGTDGVISFNVDANPLHDLNQVLGETTYRIVDGPIYWVATLDLTWIQIQ